jgi:hypothetical protein
MTITEPLISLKHILYCGVFSLSGQTSWSVSQRSFSSCSRLLLLLPVSFIANGHTDIDRGDHTMSIAEIAILSVLIGSVVVSVWLGFLRREF